jgi:Leucine Rich repeat
LKTDVLLKFIAKPEMADRRAEVDRVLREGEEALYLDSISMGTEGAAEVAEMLRGTSNAVKRLYLGGNKIGDGGALAIAEFLRSNPPALETVYLNENNIGCDGIVALADALRENTILQELCLWGNKGADSDPRLGGTEAEAAAGIDSLVAAIGVNTTLEEVLVNNSGTSDHPKTIDAALADTEGRCAGRERFLNGPATKSVHKSD